MKGKYNRYDDILVFVGENIKKRRKAVGLKQTDLAERMGYKYPQAILQAEKGIAEMPLSRLVDYARALDCNVEYLLFDQEPWARPTTEDEALGRAPVTVVKDAAKEVLELIEKKREIEAQLEDALQQLKVITETVDTQLG